MTVQLGRLGRQIVMRDEDGERFVGPEGIIRQAAHRCGVSYEDVMGRSRLPEICDGRCEAIHALADLGYQPSQIAREMGLNPSSVSFYLGRLSGKGYGRCSR